MPQVNPNILVWARESAGLSRDEAATRLKLRQARGVSPVERLAALETGEVAPSRAMLRTMAERYRRPLFVFYLPRPPGRGNYGEDFRALNRRVTPANEGLLDALVRDIRARQSLVRAALEEEEEARPIAFVAASAMEEGVEVLTSRLRETLGLSLDDFRRAPNMEEAFRRLRTHTERSGVYVLLAGDLGSHHTALDTDTFRGFALADPVAPFVAINSNDSRAAWSFTLLHELTHILLGQTGISGGPPVQVAELFCNDVASEFLLPATELRQYTWTNVGQILQMRNQIRDFSRQRNISRQLVAYRLYRARVINNVTWTELRDAFRAEWLEERDRQRDEARENDESGPSYYVIRRHRVGEALVALVDRMLKGGALTTSKAAKVLGVHPGSVGPFMDRVSAGRRTS